MIYSSMVIHVGEDGTRKFGLVDHKCGLEVNYLHQLDLGMNLRSSVIVKFIRPSIAHAVSRTNKIMVKYKSRNKLILKNSKREVEHALVGLCLFS